MGRACLCRFIVLPDHTQFCTRCCGDSENEFSAVCFFRIYGLSSLGERFCFSRVFSRHSACIERIYFLYRYCYYYPGDHTCYYWRGEKVEEGGEIKGFEFM